MIILSLLDNTNNSNCKVEEGEKKLKVSNSNDSNKDDLSASKTTVKILAPDTPSPVCFLFFLSSFTICSIFLI
jgi:hypothetical protein